MTSNDDHPQDEALEETLRRCAPRVPEASLRSQVLAAVSTELAAERRARSWRPRLRIPGWAVAASIALGIALNVWAMHGERTRDARLLGAQPPLRRVVEIAEAVRSVTDLQTAVIFEQRLIAVCREQERKARGSSAWPMLSTQVDPPG